MKDQSRQFGTADLDAFLDETARNEVRPLVSRIRAAGVRLSQLAEHVTRSAADDSDSWSAYDILAHVAVLSKFYSVLTYRVGTGQLSSLDLLPAIQDRDPAARKLAGVEPRELARMAVRDHDRLISFLETAEPSNLRALLDLRDGRMITAETIARQLMCGHMEDHLNQLERQLARDTS